MEEQEKEEAEVGLDGGNQATGVKCQCKDAKEFQAAVEVTQEAAAGQPQGSHGHGQN